MSTTASTTSLPFAPSVRVESTMSAGCPRHDVSRTSDVTANSSCRTIISDDFLKAAEHSIILHLDTDAETSRESERGER